MRRRGAKRKALPVRTLLERLAELERAIAEPNLARTCVRYRRRRNVGESFLLSFAVTCVAGGFAMGAAGLANSDVTHRSSPGTNVEGRAAAAPAADNHDTLTIESLLARNEMPEGRNLWWNVPTWQR